jgi:carbamoyltransferase
MICGGLNDGLVVGPFPDRLPGLHNELVRRAISGIPRADAAATVQDFLERIVCDFVSWHLARSDLRKLVVAGGVFSNVGLNRRLAELNAVDVLHVHPAMTDAGIALGAAAVATAERGIGLSPLESVALGPEYSELEARQAFVGAGYRIEHPSQSAERMLAGRLAAGEVVARFVGRAEYGPRALGHRSIFAPANDPRMPALLNRMLNRSTIMPFAPLARRKDEQSLFEPSPALAAPTRYMAAAMLCSHETRSRYPAIVHADGTARPQFVVEGALVDLLDELERLAGDCVLINTSFNLHDEPMVCRPEDAASSARMAGIPTVQVGSLVAVLP